MKTKPEIEMGLREIFAEIGAPSALLKVECPVTVINMDSLDKVDVVLKIEERFGISIPDDDYSFFDKTFGALIDMVHYRMAVEDDKLKQKQ